MHLKTSHVTIIFGRENKKMAVVCNLKTSHVTII